MNILIHLFLMSVIFNYFLASYIFSAYSFYILLFLVFCTLIVVCHMHLSFIIYISLEYFLQLLLLYCLLQISSAFQFCVVFAIFVFFLIIFISSNIFQCQRRHLVVFLLMPTVSSVLSFTNLFIFVS